MTSTSKSTEILKRDGRGRVRVPRERQEALLDEFERSGLSGAKFAALCGVKYPSFLWPAGVRELKDCDLEALGDYPENGLFPHPVTEPSRPAVRLLGPGFAA